MLDLGKSFIRAIQAIGRGLRKNEKEGKTHCEIFDICSSLKYSKQHRSKRIKFYKDSKYDYTSEPTHYTTREADMYGDAVADRIHAKKQKRLKKQETENVDNG